LKLDKATFDVLVWLNDAAVWCRLASLFEFDPPLTLARRSGLT